MIVSRIEDPALTAAEAEGLVAAIEALGAAWWIKDGDGCYRRVSPAAASLLGKDADQLLGRPDAQCMSLASAEALATIERQARQRGGVQHDEHTLEIGRKRVELACAVVAIDPASRGNGYEAASRADGHVLGVWLDRSELRARDAELRAVLGQLEALQQAQRQLRAEVDSADARGAARVVGRAAFDEQLAREIDLSVREHREFAVVRIDIDASAVARPDARHRVLEFFEGMLRGNTRAMDVPSRHHDEGFALLLSGVGLATAHARMEGLRRQCATQIVAHRGEALHFTVSMGVASYPHTSQTGSDLLASAQAAVSQAAERGGNQVVLASIAFAVTESPDLKA